MIVMVVSLGTNCRVVKNRRIKGAWKPGKPEKPIFSPAGNVCPLSNHWFHNCPICQLFGLDVSVLCWFFGFSSLLLSFSIYFSLFPGSPWIWWLWEWVSVFTFSFRFLLIFWSLFLFSLISCYHWRVEKSRNTIQTVFGIRMIIGDFWKFLEN